MLPSAGEDHHRPVEPAVVGEGAERLDLPVQAPLVLLSVPVTGDRVNRKRELPPLSQGKEFYLAASTTLGTGP